MRILWFNWRDIKNFDSGGAEVFTHEVVRRLAKKGYEITLFSSRFPNSLAHEVVDDVDIVRDGGKFSVYNKARNYYMKYRNDYDLIVDENNTKPFLTPKFVKAQPILAIWHSLAREIWFYETNFPLNYIGYYFLEKRWLSYYKDVPTVVVSCSTKEDLERVGFRKILLIQEGIGIIPLPTIKQKESIPIIIFIGRLKRHKLPHHAIQAFSIIKR